jgi:NTP pyrophosphatase (non-canonical NTP hydrolase)
VKLSKMMIQVREVNQANGWYDADRSFGDGIALLHSEVSEALEAYRDHGLADATKIPFPEFPEGHALHVPGALAKPEGVGSEFADVLIRLLDECDRSGIDLEAEYHRKIAFNRTRTYRHGGRSL